MAQISRPQMVQAVDPLDTIMKGLQVAGTVYGIKDAMDKNALLKQQTSLEAAKTEKANRQLELENQGYLSPKEQLDKADKYTISDQESPNAVHAKIRAKDGSLQDVYYTPKPKEVDPLIAELRKANLQNIIDKRDEVKPQEAMTAGFATRAKTSDRQLEELLKNYKPQESNLVNTKDAIVNGLPNIVSGPLKSDSRIEFDQIKNNFISAVLRKESGAAINDAEYTREEKKYFPQSGDSDEVLNQKSIARKQAIASLETGAGAKAMSKMADLLPLDTEKTKTKKPLSTADRAGQMLIKSQGLNSGIKKGSGN